MEPSHTITFQLSLADFDAFQKIGEKKNTPSWMPWLYVGIVLFVFGYATWMFLQISQNPAPIRHRQQTPWPMLFLKPLGGVLLLSIPLYFLFHNQTKKTQAELLREFSHPVTVSLAPLGFFSEGHHGEGRQRWETLHDLTETSTHLFLWINKTTAHIIPKAAFDSEEKTKAFCEAAWSYWNSSRHT